ncbi:hypothetical protein QF035_010673 [Streptomyces umbrinus]|uniref:Uncharacterized protein n=1 Tax=Streptomyces umbrinus TaxID=67370 RepID=A0ABU0TB96_9ACTN|nr:hypothetical protein [Streptomyces umbrinus]MDQ1033091.1 hypothetical protein [Streptomyces umbrinus]
MRLSTHDTMPRIWTVRLHSQPGGPLLSCPHCTLHGYRPPASSARSAALTHLARHAQHDALPGHLRTCQCRARGCSWHPRRRGCAGPVLLAATCDRSGRMWRLADACAACAAATSYTAVVPDTLPGPAPAVATSRTARRSNPLHGPGERLCVREMLTYLAVALPRYSSPAARLLALQCALRADHQGHVRLPNGFLRGMRLRGRTELWSELEHAGWLICPARPHSPMETRLLDAAMQSQASGRSARARAAHWALHPTPLAAPRGMAPSVQLTALTLAAHTCDSTGSAELDVLTRLCGQSPQQLEDLLDQLVRSRLLTGWRHISHEEISWRLSPQVEVGRAAVQR